MSHQDGGMEEIEADILHNMLTVLFGQTSEYIGSAIVDMPERRRANVVRICKIALKTLANSISDPGEIPPRIIGQLLGPGSYVRDHVASHYWAGVLAGSRTVNPHDDRAARWLHVLSRLGEYELRGHYLFYSSMRHHIMNTRQPAKIDFHEDRFHLATFIPAHFYIVAMNYNDDEITRMPRLISSVLYSLGQEVLVDGSNSGADHYLMQHFKSSTTGTIRGEGIVFVPSVLGVRLFLQAFGYRDADERFLLDPRFEGKIPDVPEVVQFSGLVYSGPIKREK